MWAPQEVFQEQLLDCRRRKLLRQRQLAQPAVLDNYVTSALQEDHLSLGTNAALKLLQVLENATQVLAIEYLLAAQAFEFHQPKHFGAGTQEAWRLLREHVAPYDQDRWLTLSPRQRIVIWRDIQARKRRGVQDQPRR